VTSNFQFSAAGDGSVEITDPAVVGGGKVDPTPADAFPGHGRYLLDIAFGAQSMLACSENDAGAGGTLTVSDGCHAASIALLGNYMAGSFVTIAEGHGGTLITEGQIGQPLLAHPRA